MRGVASMKFSWPIRIAPIDVAAFVLLALSMSLVSGYSFGAVLLIRRPGLPGRGARLAQRAAEGPGGEAALMGAA